MKVITTKPIDRRARTEKAEETMEAEVMSTSPSVHNGSWGGKEVQKGREQPKERMRKGANPDSGQAQRSS